MKAGLVKSSPRFFRSIIRSILLFVTAMLASAALFPAPLQEAASPALTPNPVKSAWFLLWIQELVSWSRFMIWLVIGLAALSFLLPWLPGQTRSHHAVWCGKSQRRIAVISLLVCAAILGLTLVAMFLRGADWSLVF